MAKDYLPNNEPQFINWAVNFSKKLPNYQAQFELNQTEIDDVQNMLNKSKELIEVIGTMKTALQSKVQEKNNMVADLELEVRRIAKSIKAKKTYSTVSGEDLGIVSPEVPAKGGYEDAVPEFFVTTMPGKNRLDWQKKNFDGVVIECMRGKETAFSFVDRDARSPYEDMRKNLVEGEPELRIYRLKYLLNEIEVGQYSLEARVVCLI